MIIKTYLDSSISTVAENDKYLTAVLSILKKDGELTYASLNQERVGYIQSNSSYTVELIDDYIPKDWVEIKQGDDLEVSFTEWLNEPAFFEYLLEDWDPDKHAWAVELANKWYREIVDEYATRLCGSPEQAREQAAKMLHRLQEEEYEKITAAYPVTEIDSLPPLEYVSYSGPITLDELQLVLEPRVTSIHHPKVMLWEKFKDKHQGA